jgi:hypothetical protein
MNKTFGAFAGAFLGVKGAQSGTDSLTSSFTTPLKGILSDTAGVSFGCPGLHPKPNAIVESSSACDVVL